MSKRVVPPSVHQPSPPQKHKADLKHIDDEYVQLQRVGTGTFGAVCFGEHKVTKEPVAIKV